MATQGTFGLVYGTPVSGCTEEPTEDWPEHLFSLLLPFAADNRLP